MPEQLVSCGMLALKSTTFLPFVASGEWRAIILTCSLNTRVISPYAYARPFIDNAMINAEAIGILRHARSETSHISSVGGERRVERKAVCRPDLRALASL